MQGKINPRNVRVNENEREEKERERERETGGESERMKVRERLLELQFHRMDRWENVKGERERGTSSFSISSSSNSFLTLFLISFLTFLVISSTLLPGSFFSHFFLIFFFQLLTLFFLLKLSIFLNEIFSPQCVSLFSPQLFS